MARAPICESCRSKPPKKLFYVEMTQYGQKRPGLASVIKPDKLEQFSRRYCCLKITKNLRTGWKPKNLPTGLIFSMAASRKTVFCRRESLVHSPRSRNYDLQPEMSARNSGLRCERDREERFRAILHEVRQCRYASGMPEKTGRRDQAVEAVAAESA